jgi:hypothetical protein
MGSVIFRIFAVAYASKVSIARKALLILSLSIKSANFMKEDGAFCFRLSCMLLFHSAYRSGVRYVPWKSLMVFTRSFKVFADTYRQTDMST